MRDSIYWIKTDCEHGLTEKRLKNALVLFGRETIKLPEIDVARTHEGKPYVSVPGIFCSVSHSGGIWLCAVSTKQIGVDLQYHDGRNEEKIAKRFFHPNEVKYLDRNGYDKFYDIWCAKESYLKYTGEGLPGGLELFSVTTETEMLDTVNGVKLRQLCFSKGYSLCLCGGNDEEVSINRIDE